MSKITKALQKASEQRSNDIFSSEESARVFVQNTKESKMRKTWFTWAIVTTAVVTVFFAFNYHGGKDAVPLSEIFPDEGAFPADIEYEFVQDEAPEKAVEETVADVVEEQIVPAEVTKAPAVTLGNKEVVNNFNYTVQIASFKDQKKAEEALSKIRTKVPSAYISSKDLGVKGVWYRIYAGQFELRSEAEVTLNDIKQKYNSSFIISPKKAK